MYGMTPVRDFMIQVFPSRLRAMDVKARYMKGIEPRRMVNNFKDVPTGLIILKMLVTKDVANPERRFILESFIWWRPCISSHSSS